MTPEMRQRLLQLSETLLDLQEELCALGLTRRADAINAIRKQIQVDVRTVLDIPFPG